LRITLSEAETIVHYTRQIFGPAARVFLFGSRADDELKGGDIDLYIEGADSKDLLEKKLHLITLLEKALGEQKIDIVFHKDTTRDIEREALSKGVELDILNLKLTKYLRECEKHIQRIDEAYEDMKNIIPLSTQRYKTLTKDEVQDIDQFLFRFAMLQDTMGDKIFKLILEKYEGSVSPMPFLDKLNKLEKYGCINSAKEWVYLRKLRNEVAHQYDDEAEEMSQAINALILQKEIIKEIYQKLKSCVTNAKESS